MMLVLHLVKVWWAVKNSVKVWLAVKLQLQADWMIPENNEKATLNIKMLYYSIDLKGFFFTFDNSKEYAQVSWYSTWQSSMQWWLYCMRNNWSQFKRWHQLKITLVALLDWQRWALTRLRKRWLNIWTLSNLSRALTTVYRRLSVTSTGLYWNICHGFCCSTDSITAHLKWSWMC